MNYTHGWLARLLMWAVHKQRKRHPERDILVSSRYFDHRRYDGRVLFGETNGVSGGDYTFRLGRFFRLQYDSEDCRWYVNGEDNRWLNGR